MEKAKIYLSPSIFIMEEENELIVATSDGPSQISIKKTTDQWDNNYRYVKTITIDSDNSDDNW